MSIFKYFGPAQDTENISSKSYECLKCVELKRNQTCYRATVGVASSNLTKHLRIHTDLFQANEQDLEDNKESKSTPKRKKIKLDFDSLSKSGTILLLLWST